MRSLYDQTSAHYDDRYWEIQIHKYSAFEKDFLTNKAPLIVDSGGGTGLLARYLNREIVVIDLSVGMLKVASSKYPNVHLIAADAERLPLRCGSSDLVVSFSMIQNLPNPEKGISEIIRCSSHDGIVTGLSKIISQDRLVGMIDMFSVDYEIVDLSQEDVAVRFTQ